MFVKFIWVNGSQFNPGVYARYPSARKKQLCCYSPPRSGQGLISLYETGGVIRWWSQSGSNRRPLQCHCSALPAELWPLKPSHLFKSSGFLPASRFRCKENIPADVMQIRYRLRFHQTRDQHQPPSHHPEHQSVQRQMYQLHLHHHLMK